MKTEFTELDKYINLDEPKLILLGGKKGVGKTTLLANIAANISLHQNVPVLFFSLEEDYIRTDMKELSHSEFTKQIKDLPNNFCISDKIILKESSVTADETRIIRSPYLGELLNQNSYYELYDAIDYLNKSPLFVKDKMPITINEIVQSVKEYVEKEHIKLVILDNIKLIQYGKNQMFDKEDETTHSMEILKQLCAIFNITILVTGDLTYFGTNHFELPDDMEEDYTKTADIFMMIHRKEQDIFIDEEINEINIKDQNSNEINKIELMYNNCNFQYLNMPEKYSKIKQEEYEEKLKILFNKIEKNDVIFLNSCEFQISQIINIIEEETEKQNIKCRVCDDFEFITIEKLIDNNLKKYIENFKDIEIVIFVFYGKFDEKIKHFIYDISKKILNTGVKKTGIFISDYYGVITEFGPEEFGQEDDYVIFF